MTPRRDPRHPPSAVPPRVAAASVARPSAAALLATVILAVPASLLAVCPAALAQAPGAPVVRRLEAPRGAAAADYLRTARAAGLQVEIDYLPPDAPFDADLPRAERPRSLDDAFGGIAPEWRAAAWAVLALLAAGVLVLALRYRHVLAELFAADRAFAPPGASPATEAEAGVDHDLLARLRAEPDPRVGLRLLLARFLALAARENALVLRRGLTTREVLRALPGSWHHRGDLERLAERVELSVFGGRAMGRDDYLACVDLAAPLLFRVGPA